MQRNFICEITHAECVEAAAKWASARCSIVITELASAAGQEPDVFALDGQKSYLIECKVSRSDFLRDHKKGWQHYGGGIGQVRFYCAPAGLIKPDELPDGWGLLEISRKTCVSVKPQERGWHDCCLVRERTILHSALRRFAIDAPSVSVKSYVLPSKCKATIGIEPLEGA